MSDSSSAWNVKLQWAPLKFTRVEKVKIIYFHVNGILCVSFCSQQQFFDRLYFIYTVGYAVSFGSLMVAILIIGYFR